MIHHPDFSLSAINNSTRPGDTSMNTTSQDILNKLSMVQKSGGSNEINNNFDSQSQASYFFNEDELANYEENIQQKINDIWTEI